MKPKYFPLITLLAAVGLLLLPLCLLLMVTHQGSSYDGELDRQLAETMAAEHRQKARTAPANAAPPMPVAPVVDRVSVSESHAGSVETLAISGTVPTTAFPQVNSGRTSETSTGTAIGVEPGIASSRSEMVSGVGVGGNRGVGGRVGEVVDEIGLRLPELPAITGSYYDSTGHLALRDAGGARSDQPAGSIKPESDASRAFLSGKSGPAPKGTDDSGQSRMIAGNVAPSPPGNHSAGDEMETERSTSDAETSSTRTGAGTAAKNRKSRSKPAAPTVDQVPLPPNDGPEEVVEDVLVQTPLENRLVNRIEDVVAVTKAKGWPIALVRSDLPGDDWWVQQMVGISGNSFAARVNFGNENSISGSAYRMVFVFLDSPEEVRRFRIAKQFKEIPEGVRRSREYRFVRD